MAASAEELQTGNSCHSKVCTGLWLFLRLF